MMKKQIVPGCIIFLLSLTAAIGSVTFLGPCIHEDGTFGACYWAGRSIFGLSLLLVCISLFAVLMRKARSGLYMSMVPASVLGILTPGTLINLCGMSNMHCRAVMQPAMIIVFSAAGLTALCGAIVCAREKKERA